MDMVSIVVLSEGDSRKLALTLDSLLRQNYKQTEIIVAERLGPSGVPACPLGEYEQLQYLALPARWSRGACLNAAARLVRGEYVTFLQAGAVVYPTWLSVAVRTLGSSFKPGWCYTGAGVRGGAGCLPPRDWPDFKLEGRIFPDLITNWSVSLQAVVMTREQLRRLGSFDEDLTALVEEEFLLRLALHTPAQYSRTKMVELEPPQLQTPQALVSRCYFMSEFLAPLDRLGLGDKVLGKLLEDIDDAGTWKETEGYLSILAEHPLYQRCIADYQARTCPKREMILADTPNVSGVVDCVGCGSCQGKCPTGAISMELNEEGFLYPRVDDSLCTRCGLCLKGCPTQRELSSVPMPKTCYALQAADDVRMKASSGGVFPLLAQAILEDGGYVAGAVFDQNFAVRHIVSNRPEDVRAMQTSKYVQSRTAEVYPQVKQLLEGGKTVLFTGTACQVAGLSAFLGKEYDNLYTMDVVCHGVPSPGVFAHYLNEFRRSLGKLVEVNFRKKDVFGWYTNLYVRGASGKAYIPKQLDPYMFCFLSDWILRESCYHCSFKGMKYSDLSAADFWGIQALDDKFEDGKGSSYLTVNTEKGKRLYERIQGGVKKSQQFKQRNIRMVLDAANPQLFTSVAKPAFRELFFRHWKQNPAQLGGVLTRAFQRIHFDAALILHWSPNFGNAMTNYGLYSYLSKTRNVVAVDNCGALRPSGIFRRFAKEHYICSSDYFPTNGLQQIEQSCSALVVGSDQVWNRYFNEGMGSGTYYQLSFAGDNIRKIAYGASFGTKGAEPDPKKCGPLFRRFDKIGVREKFGVDACRELYGVEAEQVLDPVFLPDSSEYEKLAAQSKMNETEPFILAYILNPSEEKSAACRQLQQQLGEDMKIISICEPVEATIDLSRHQMDFAYVQGHPTIEDFLYLYKNCRYVVTDSFHGTCFSIIFGKNFMSFVNRQPDRFTVFQQFGDASTHIGDRPSPKFQEQCLQPLDYDSIQRDLERERERSRKWLDDALK